ncbi:hypothetical protein [Microcoleus sp. FACHB-SPT15]|uniref:hypothetical protein n=1 Tax=Microcoleus sp. FACHB-SPT15 TaxID=2692830 RepID=UPI001F5559B0|nr:hypothetical protein [Microcoleus sp. FACHB-SPT15]
MIRIAPIKIRDPLPHNVKPSINTDSVKRLTLVYPASQEGRAIRFIHLTVAYWFVRVNGGLCLQIEYQALMQQIMMPGLPRAVFA